MALRTPTTILAPLLPALLVAVAACAGDASGPADAGEVATWTATRDLRIGSVDDSIYALTWLRDLEVGEDGTIYTLHPQEQRLRRFGPDGTFLGDVGRRGEGPGEFQNVGGMGWLADTLWVLDLDGYRFMKFTEDGSYLGEFRVPFDVAENPGDPSPPRAYGLLFDGTVHGAPPVWSSQVASGEITERRPMLLDREGRVTDTLPPVPLGNNQWAIYDPDDPEAGGSYGRQPFGDGPLSAFVPGERAVLHLHREAPREAGEATFSLTKMDFGGDTLFHRRYPYDPVPLSETEVDSVLDARAEALGSSGFLGLTVPRAREWAERTLYQPPFKSPVEAMVVGRDGTIWLDRTEAPWLVLDPSGEPLAEVELPEDVRVVEADRDRVWGWRMDELDVPYVVRFRVDEAPPPTS